MKDLLHAFRRLAFPIRSGDHVNAALVAGGTAADVVEVEGVGVDKLDAEVAFLFDRRHGQHDRFGPEVHADKGIGRVGVGRLDRRILRCVNARNVVDLVPSRLELGVLAIDEIAILNAVVIHQWEAVDVGFLGDGAGFSWRNVGSAGGEGERQRKAERSQDGFCFHSPLFSWLSYVQSLLGYRQSTRREG